ncbi:MAG TPA: copper chaperone PCu(A)C [Gammaproteobacteria bacterium]
MKYRTLISACLLLFGSLAFGDGPAVSASHVWIRTAPAGVQSLSGFMTLENLTGKPLEIVSISSPDFGSVTIGQAEGPAVKTVTLPPGKPVVLNQDGDHLRLRQPHKRLFDGDMVTLTFKFSDGSVLTLLASVRRVSPGK